MPFIFNFTSQLPINTKDLFNWHKRPGALERLTPGWSKMKILKSSGGIELGGWVQLKTGPLGGILWELVHDDYQEGILFTDRALKSPFKSWKHKHVFESLGDQQSLLKDYIQYEMPWGCTPFKFYIENLLERIFKARMLRLLDEINFFGLNTDATPLTLAITGSSGLIGESLLPLLKLKGHCIRIIQRGDPIQSENSIYYYNAINGNGLKTALEGVDVVVHLAGEPILGYWTQAKKEAIYQSRVYNTRLLVKAIKELKIKPNAFVMASAVGYYGNSTDGVNEYSPKGKGFLPIIVADWESEATPLKEMGIRLVQLRLGTILSAKKGLLPLVTPFFSIGLGHVLGNQKNYFPWIDIEDVVNVFYHAIIHTTWSGIINVVAPEIITQNIFSSMLATTLKRPCAFTISEKFLKLIGGEFATTCCLNNQKIVSNKLPKYNYKFMFPSLKASLTRQLGQ